MKKYSHIKKTERLEIAILLKKGYSIRSIAKVLKRGIGSISDEIKRNSTNNKYNPLKANHKAYVKRKYAKYQGMKIVNNIELRNYVEKKLKEEWSPEQIAGRLKEIDKHIKYASHNAIYKFIHSSYGKIDGNKLTKYLKYRNRKYRKRKSKLKKLQDRTFIDNRPNIINNRERYGDWEGDFIVSGKRGKGVLLVLHERKSRYIIIRKIMSRKTKVVNDYMKNMIGGLIHFESLTLDNDISFTKHKQLSSMLDAPIYFCHPYHSWEKGGVENSNKLIRYYVPKGTDISRFSIENIERIEYKLNNKPRKCLNYKSSLEVMKEEKQLNDLYIFNINQKIKVNKKNQAVRLGG